MNDCANLQVRNRVVLAGFSQGAALAVYLALKKTIGCNGFPAVASSDWVAPENRPARQRTGLSETFKRFIQSSDGRGLKGWLLVGDRDPFFSKISSLHDEMTRIGVNCRLVIGQDLGHEFPSDFASRLSSAVEFVLTSQS